MATNILNLAAGIKTAGNILNYYSIYQTSGILYITLHVLYHVLRKVSPSE